MAKSKSPAPKTVSFAEAVDRVTAIEAANPGTISPEALATVQNMARSEAESAAIIVKSESVAPIATDLSNQWESFTTRPGVAATGSAFKTAGTGFKTIWTEEKENEYGKSFMMWGFSIFKAIALPLLSLIWLALNHVYQIARKPEAKASVITRYQSVKAWLAPKFNYEREQTDEAALKL